MRNMYCKLELMVLNKDRNPGSELCEDFGLKLVGKVPKPLHRAGGLKGQNRSFSPCWIVEPHRYVG